MPNPCSHRHHDIAKITKCVALHSFGYHTHKPHHVFFNPSPFAVIADEALDQVLLAARPPPLFVVA